jgi:hypothetical protein
MTRPSGQLLWLVLGLVCAFGVGWLVVPAREQAGTLVGVRSDRWNGLQIPRAVDQLKSATMVGVAPYWGPGDGKAKPSPQAAPENSTWWVAGVYGPGSLRTALVLFGDPKLPPLRLNVGGRLPSGHTIVSIGDVGVCIRIGDSSYTLGVERRER